MDFLVHADHFWGECRLTSEGLPGSQRRGVFLIIDERAFRPSDMIEVDGKAVLAARLVCAWAAKPGRTKIEVQAACQYLRQCPDGPQIGGAS